MSITDLAQQLSQATLTPGETKEEVKEPEKVEEPKVQEAKEEPKTEETKEEVKEEEKTEELPEDVVSQRAQNRFQKLANERRALLEENEKLKKELEDRPFTKDEEEENKLIDERIKKLGYVKQDDLRQMEEEKEKHEIIEQEKKAMETELDNLEKEFKGVYDRNTVINYMKEKGVYDPRAAFFATSYDKLKIKENRNVGYEGLAGNASGNNVSTGDTVVVGKPTTQSISDIASRLAKATLS